MSFIVKAETEYNTSENQINDRNITHTGMFPHIRTVTPSLKEAILEGKYVNLAFLLINNESIQEKKEVDSERTIMYVKPIDVRRDLSNNSRFGDFVDHFELEIMDTTDTDMCASYIDIHFEIDSRGRLRTKLYDKRDDFNIIIADFTIICSNISPAPAYGVYLSQLARYSRDAVPNRISLIDGCC